MGHKECASVWDAVLESVAKTCVVATWERQAAIGHLPRMGLCSQRCPIALLMPRHSDCLVFSSLLLTGVPDSPGVRRASERVLDSNTLG